MGKRKSNENSLFCRKLVPKKLCKASHVPNGGISTKHPTCNQNSDQLSICRDYLNRLPNELAEKILSYLSHQDLLNLECVSHNLRQIVLNQRLWIALLRKHVAESSSWQRIAKHFDASQMNEQGSDNDDAKHKFCKILQTELNWKRNWNNFIFKKRNICLNDYPTGLVMDDHKIFFEVYESEQSIITIFNRLTLTMDKEFLAPEPIASILPITDDIIVYGSFCGSVNILNWKNEISVGRFLHPLKGSVVKDLAFSSRTLVTRSIDLGNEDWSLIKIHQFSSCFSTVTEEMEIYLPTVRGYGLGFYGIFLVVHTVAECSSLNHPDAVIQIRTGKDWKVEHEISVPFRRSNDFQYGNRLIVASCDTEIRIFDVETGSCKTTISMDFNIMPVKLAFPFVLVCHNHGRKTIIWNLTSPDSENPLSQMDFPSCGEILFDELQVVGILEKNILVYDILSRPTRLF